MYQQKCPIYQNSKAVRDMVLLLMIGRRLPGKYCYPICALTENGRTFVEKRYGLVLAPL